MYNDSVLRDRDPLTWISAAGTENTCFKFIASRNGAIGGKENDKK